MKKIISMLLVIAIMLTVLTVGIATTSAAETATITVYGLDGSTQVKEVGVGEEFTVYSTLDVTSSVSNGLVGSIQGSQTYTSDVLSLTDGISGQYGEIVDLVKVFPVTGDATMANGSAAGKITYNASAPSASTAFKFDSAHALLIVTTYKVTKAGTAEVKNALRNLAAADEAITKIVYEGQVQQGKSISGIASFEDPTPAIDHAEVRVHSLSGATETLSFNVGDTFNVYTTLNASSVNSGKMASVNGLQRYTSSVLELQNTIFPVMGDKAIANTATAGSIKYAGSNPSTSSPFVFDSDDDQLLVSTYKVVANGYADVTNRMIVLAAADEDITKIVFGGEVQPGMSYSMTSSFSADGPIPTQPPTTPQPTTPPPTAAPTTPQPTTPPTTPSQKLDVTIINPDNSTVKKTFNIGDTFTVYTVLNMGGQAADVDGYQTYPTASLQLTDAVTGEYNEIVNKTAMFPILGDEVVATAQNGTIKFNATRPGIGKGYAFNSDASKLIVTNYKVLAGGEATVKTALKTLVKDDAAVTKVVYNGTTQSGQSYSMPGSFTDPGPVQPTTPEPTTPEPTQAPTEPVIPTEPQTKAAVTIYGIDGTSTTKYFDVGKTFTVYTTFDASQATDDGMIASISASQTFTDSILQSADAVDSLNVVIDNTAMFPILKDKAVAKITTGLNKYNASTPNVSQGFKFDSDKALLIVSNYTVKAVGNAEIRNNLTTVAAADINLTRIVFGGVVQGDKKIGGTATFYDPNGPIPTEPPVPTDAPTEPPVPTNPPTEPPVPTEPPTDPPVPTNPPTEPPTEIAEKANVTIYGFDGTSITKSYAVGETFTVYTTFNASQAIGDSMVASISAIQTFNDNVLTSADAVDSLGIVTDNNTMFPILKDKAIAKISGGLNKYNASTPNIGQGFKFDSDQSLLIVTKYTVKTAGNAEIRNTLTTVAAADENLTRIVDKGVVQDGKTIGGKATFTAPDQPQPTEPPTPTQPEPTTGEKYMLGDADNNDDVESIDATLVQRRVAFMKVNVDTDILDRNGDVDMNEELEIVDATYIQRFLAFMRTDYPIGEYISI